jgi:hypothetical protein
MRDGVNVRRLPNRLIRLQTTLRVNKMRSKDGVDQCRLSKSRLACPPNKIIRKVPRNFTEERRGDSTRQRSSNQHYRIRKLTDDDDIKLEAALEELFLDLTGDGVEADVRRCSDLLCGWLRHIY